MIRIMKAKQNNNINNKQKKKFNIKPEASTCRKLMLQGYNKQPQTNHSVKFVSAVSVLNNSIPFSYFLVVLNEFLKRYHV